MAKAKDAAKTTSSKVEEVPRKKAKVSTSIIVGGSPERSSSKGRERSSGVRESSKRKSDDAPGTSKGTEPPEKKSKQSKSNIIYKNNQCVISWETSNGAIQVPQVDAMYLGLLNNSNIKLAPVLDNLVTRYILGFHLLTSQGMHNVNPDLIRRKDILVTRICIDNKQSKFVISAVFENRRGYLKLCYTIGSHHHSEFTVTPCLDG